MTVGRSRRHFCRAALGAGAALVPLAATGAPAATRATEAGATAARPARAASWPQDQALPTLPEPYRLDVCEVDGLSVDERLLLSTLQGVTARRRPCLYLSAPFEEGRHTWLRELEVPYAPVNGLATLVRRYRSEIRGAIVTDPAVPATRNVATTLAGLENAVAATAGLASRLGLPVVKDLRGRFKDATSAYAWAARELWPRCTHRMLVAVDPQRNAENLRDYAVAHRAFVLWADPTRAKEAALLTSLLRGMPDNSPFLGWFPNDRENAGTELASRHGAYVVAADYINNLTVFAGAQRRYASRQPAAAPPRLRRRIYVTFTFTEGDNLQYNQHRLRKLWDDPARGQVPLNWSVSPLAADAASLFLSYYQRTATRHDLLVAGPSGLGYAYPDDWPAGKLSHFTRQTGAYMRDTGLPALCALNRAHGRDINLSAGTLAAYARDVRPAGIWQHWTSHFGTALSSGMPVSTARLVADVHGARQVLAKAAQGWKGTAPLFLTIGVLAWTLTPGDVAEIAQGLDERFTVVRGDQFFELIRQAR
ncbi:GxGYxYP domain-containing protein [Streptomyces sp. NPDC052396]|uniref:GxGYxYP domain-containing protein n=1 Tax=Streptomyces sp. NPDC052396 TaxID=3365689 RepID=UPI0037D5A66A